MGCVKNESLSLFVGWLSIVLSFFVPITQILLYMQQYESDLSTVIHDDNFQMYMIYLACSFVPWLIASILLVKGIRQNQHKLMAPWLYLNYVLVAITCTVMVYVCLCMSRFGGSWQVGLYHGLPYAGGLVILLLCLIPVRKLYKTLSDPPLILPTQ